MSRRAVFVVSALSWLATSAYTPLRACHPSRRHGGAVDSRSPFLLTTALGALQDRLDVESKSGPAHKSAAHAAAGLKVVTEDGREAHAVEAVGVPQLVGGHAHRAADAGLAAPAAVAPASAAELTTAFDPEEMMISSELEFEDKMSMLWDYFSGRPWLLGSRLLEISAVAAYAAAAWIVLAPPQDKAGDGGAPANAFSGSADAMSAAESFGSASLRARLLREGISRLGVVFVKLAQTLATRPDVVGDEVAAALAVLQDANRPFAEEEARRIVRDAYGADATDVFDAYPEEPSAAASMAQVYRCRTKSGLDVAVKVRRPRVAALVASDVCCVRLILKGLRAAGLLSEEADIQEMTAEVSAGLMRELDFTLEGKNALRFASRHRDLRCLRVPRPVPELSSREVLVLEWAEGRKMPTLSNALEKRRAVDLALGACFAQLLNTGLVHADPHHGNMLYVPLKGTEPPPEADASPEAPQLPEAAPSPHGAQPQAAGLEGAGPGSGGEEGDFEGWLSLLDFGLVTEVDDAKMEAMASGILHCLQEQWRPFLEDMTQLGLLPKRPAVWVDKSTGERVSGLQPGVWKEVSQEEFVSAFEAHLQETARTDASGRPRRRSFSEMTTDLSALSLSYRFLLPSWMIFVVRAVVTLDGFAQALDPPLNAMQAAAPHALRRALTPSTPKGRAALEGLLLDADSGDLNWALLDEMLQTARAASAGAPAPPAADLPDWYEDPSGVKAFPKELLDTFWGRERGAALRRIAYKADSPRILRSSARRLFGLVAGGGLSAAHRRALLAAAASALRPGRPAPSEAAPEAARGPEPAPERAADDFDFFESGSDAVAASRGAAFPERYREEPPPPQWRGAAVRRVLVARHLRAVLGTPRGLCAAVAAAAAAALVLSQAAWQEAKGGLARRARGLLRRFRRGSGGAPQGAVAAAAAAAAAA